MLWDGVKAKCSKVSRFKLSTSQCDYYTHAKQLEFPREACDLRSLHVCVPPSYPPTLPADCEPPAEGTLNSSWRPTAFISRLFSPRAQLQRCTVSHCDSHSVLFHCLCSPPMSHFHTPAAWPGVPVLTPKETADYTKLAQEFPSSEEDQLCESPC